MQRFRNKIFAALGLAMTISTGVACADSDEREDGEHKRFSFALWGDMPYVTPVAVDTQSPKIPRLIADINTAKVAFTVFDGDIKSGSSLCTNDVYTTAAAYFGYDKFHAGASTTKRSPYSAGLEPSRQRKLVYDRLPCCSGYCGCLYERHYRL